MVITEKMFEEYKKTYKKGDCLVYAEAKDGQFNNSMMGEAYDINVALCCLIQRFAENCDASPFEVIADITDMIKTYIDMKDQEGGDR